MSSESSNSALDEWKEARAVLARFDTSLHEIRKYGFTVLAALLTIDSLVKASSLDSYSKLGLIGITIAFIVTLRLLDYDYSQFQNAASIRARILESVLNVELTETITRKYEREKLYNLIQYLYFAFVGIAGCIGIIILPFGRFWLVAVLFALVGIVAIWYIPNVLKLNLRRKDSLQPDDWIIDKLSIEKGETVKITVTNLCKDTPIVFMEGGPIFEIWEEGTKGVEGSKAAHIEPMPRPIEILGGMNYSWLWDSNEGGQPGKIYRFWGRGWAAPLPRSIVIRSLETKPRPEKQPYDTGTPSSPNLPWAR